MTQNQTQFEKSIPRYVNEHQVTIINNLVISGKIPTYLAQAGYKVLVVGSDKKLVPRLRVQAQKGTIDNNLTIKYTSEFFDYHSNYNILYMNYGKEVIDQLLSLKDSNVPVVLCLEDSINFFCCDLLIGLSRFLMQNGVNLKLVVLNYILKYNEKLQNFFEDTVIVNAPEHYNVSFIQLPTDNMCEILLNQLANGNDHSFLVFLSTRYKLNEFYRTLKSGITTKKIGNIKIIILDSTKYNYKEIQQLIYSDAFTRKVVISIDNNIFKFPIELDFDVILDDGLEKVSKLYPSSGRQISKPNKISKTLISQRQSLAGRYSPGNYYLCSNIKYDNRKEVTYDRSPCFIKMVLSLQKSNITIDFMQSKNKWFFCYSLKILKALGAIKEDNTISETGKEILRIPFDILFSRVFLQAKVYEVEFDILICYIIYKFGKICTLSTPTNTGFKSDLFDQLLIFKKLYFENELSITNAQINHSAFNKNKSLLDKLCDILSVKPSKDTNIIDIKKCIAYSLPNSLFILNDKSEYKSLAEPVTFYLPKDCSFVLDTPCKYLLGFPSYKEEHGKFRHIISCPTELSLDEVNDYFVNFFRTVYSVSANGHVIQKNYYNNFCISSKTVGTLD